MRIAVSSQNRKDVTGHAGRCRNFWIYEVEGRTVKAKTLLELRIEQTFHANHGPGAHPLDDVRAIITGGMGPGLQTRLHRLGIDAVITTEANPDQAVDRYLAGQLDRLTPEAHACHAHSCEGHHDSSC